MPALLQHSPRLFSALGFLLLGTSAACAGVVEPYAPNKAAISVAAFARYDASDGFLLNESKDQDTASVPGAPGYRNLLTSTAWQIADPGSHPKDMAVGTVSLNFDAGAGGDPDTMSIEFSGSVSNFAGLVGPTLADFGSVGLKASAYFYLDPFYSGMPAGTLVGSIYLNGLRPAEDYETFSLTVDDGGRPLLTIAPGDPGANVPLYSGNGYSIFLEYSMVVPAGIDPPFALSAGGSIQAVPEPAPALLLATGIAALALRSRHRPGRSLRLG
jgi:hypothetical protein